MAALPGSKNFVMVATHGGACCGMTHIFEFGLFHNPCYPDNLLEERKAMTYDEVKTMRASFPLHALWNTNFSYPEQTALDRLKMCIKNIRSGRKAGVIEIILMPKQLGNWRPSIEALGFKCVSEGHNSNTGNVIRIFHFVYGDQDPDDD